MIKRCCCRTDREVRCVLIRAAHQKTDRPILDFICNACNYVQPSNVPAVVMGGDIYCETDAFKKAKLAEPDLVETNFRHRLRPYLGVSRLRRYDAVL